MTEENIIKLTNALYKVTDLFPKEEPLKFAIRKEGLDVMFFSNLVKGKSLSSTPKEKEQYLDKVLSKIELIKTYFSIAKEQEWVAERNFEVLEREYEVLKDSLGLSVIKDKEVKKPIAVEIQKEESVAVFANMGNIKEEKAKEDKKVEMVKREVKHLNYEELSSVQLKVLEILQSKGQLKANQISECFPEMNPRTIRRELKGLKEMKIISCMGGGKMTAYKISES
ncbi:MAG TPA: hypothetical protein PLD14_00160 [Candidatus Pacearchaeota archaeon]|nr:hypothetical protein [Candidatus Pacearchaeota archaeon]HPR79627.1 hypothetical protein [Candidatus Pacearchaeota archaeon]